LQAVYPDYVPQAEKLRGYWKDKENQKAFFEKLATKLNIKKPEDWNKVTTELVKKEGGGFVNRYYSSSVIQGNIITSLVNLSKSSKISLSFVRMETIQTPTSYTWF
jgi:hypothetical protein